MDFVHLHNHSEYSLLDGASRIEEMVLQAKEFGMEALALTDHGNMFGAINFYQTAQQAKIKPIIGAEIYVAPRDRREKEIRSDVPEASFHLTVLCQNETGYYNLIKLVSYAYLEGFYYKPRVDKELLSKYSSGLIALSGCLKGEVNWYLLRNEQQKAMEAAASYQEIFGQKNFFLEIMRNGLSEQEQIIPGVIEISQALDVPLVATNDCHYIMPDDARVQDVLLCIQTGKRLKDKDRLRLNSTGFYFRSPAEMKTLFADLPEAIKSTVEIAERCNLLIDIGSRRFHLPAYSPPSEFQTDFDYLSHLAHAGLKKMYSKITAELTSRLEYELSVIRRMGFAGYFLIVRDIVVKARELGIPVGPGRGSAGGSLVLYCLGVTDIDPIRYGLLFERFLSPERITLPDVDIDFADSRRGEVIDYIRRRYGEDSVAQIITFGTMQARAAVRDVGRVLDVPIGEVDQIAKLIPPGMSLEGAEKEVEELASLISSQPRYQELWTIAKKIEGLNRHASIHASAIVITPRPIWEFVPLYKMPDSEVCTQYDMHSLDAIGLLKMDVLGLRTLTVIDETEKLVRTHTPNFSLRNISLEDLKTYELLQQAETVGVFQLESPGMRNLCKKIKPERIEHIIALIALYRPGPMELIPKYLERKSGKEPVVYDHPLLESVCQETYGIMIYQEQVIQAAQVLAGYSLAQADILRRAMGKKKVEEMAAQRQTFIEGCSKVNNIPADKAGRIFDLLERFAGYGFNKAHAAGYAHLAYITAYLKANYPVEFITASLISELGNFDKLAKFVTEARRMDIKILPPDINRSDLNFTVEEGSVRYGLAGLKNIGIAAAEAIVQERTEHGPYKSLLDFLMRNRGRVNRKAVESLIKAGAFEQLQPDRFQLFASLEKELAKAASERLLYRERQFDLFGSQEEEETANRDQSAGDHDTLVAFEKASFGYYFSAHPLQRYLREYRALQLKPISVITGLNDNAPVAVAGVITEKRSRKDKRNRDYFIVTIEDFDSAVEVMVFADILEKTRGLLMPERLIVVQGRVKNRVGGSPLTDRYTESHSQAGMPQIWAERIFDFTTARQFISAVNIHLPVEGLNDFILQEIKRIVESFPGDVPISIVVNGQGFQRGFQLRNYQVKIDDQLVEELEKLIGKDRVTYRATLPQVVQRFNRTSQ